jgi:IS5 family transposase
MRRASVGRLGVTMAQMGLFDLLDRYASLDAKRDPLVEFDAVVPWEEFRPMQERIWRKPEAEHKSRARRKPLYNLPDDQIKYQLRDRLSVRTVPRPLT